MSEGRVAGSRPFDAGSRPLAIGFRPLAGEDLPLVHRWRQTSHVRRWWRDTPDPATLAAKLLPRIRGERPTDCFLILVDGRPIGFVQTYMVHDYPDYAAATGVGENTAGLDIFIGEEDCLHRGLGPAALKGFLEDIVFADSGRAPHLRSPDACVVGPEPDNRAAIRAYAKAGFLYLKTVEVPGEPAPEYLMMTQKEAWG